MVRFPEPAAPASRQRRPTAKPPTPVSSSSSGMPEDRTAAEGAAGLGAALPNRVSRTLRACWSGSGMAWALTHAGEKDRCLGDDGVRTGRLFHAIERMFDSQAVRA